MTHNSDSKPRQRVNKKLRQNDYCKITTVTISNATEFIVAKKEKQEDEKDTKPKRKRKSPLDFTLFIFFHVLAASDPKPGCSADLQKLFEDNFTDKRSVIELKLPVCPKWAKLCKNHTEEKSVVMLIVCSSAHRVLDFIKQLTTFKVLKLFAKHFFFVEEQIKLLQKGVTHMGTPRRIKALTEQDGLSLKALTYVVLDWNWRDQKLRRMPDIPEVDYTEERECADCYALRLDRANSIIDCACTVSFSLSEAFKGDVFMYYGLTNFHQNQRHYMVSRDNAQLVGRQYNLKNPSITCIPFDKYKNGTPIAPCGAIANSIFNDTLQLFYHPDKNTETPVPLLKTDISWFTDRTVKFQNPSPIAPCGAIANSIFNDTLQLFYHPDKNTETPVPLLKTDISWFTDRTVKFQNPSPKDNLTAAFAGTARPFYWWKPVYQLSVEKNNNGFVNEDLIVWMRQAAFPSFKKLYRRLNRTQEFNEGLPAGNYSVKISYRFNAMDTSGIIRGMQGNNWTEADLEFVQRMKNEKSVMQLKEELKRLQRELKDEMQKKELLWAQKEKIQTDTVNMEETIDRTVQLGRAFLCRKMDPSIVEPLCPESVLKQLSVASVQQVIQQETAKLQALEEKLTGKQKQASHQIKQLQIEMRNKEIYYLEKIKSQKGKVLMEQELVDNLKDQLSELQEKLAETREHFKSMKSQIEDLQAKQMENYSGTVNMAKIEQRLKRLERRKELFLERRRIMQRLCSMDR
ncbi:UNVERIFIED_CONTAM: hypothetical protein FKN15_008540 [Acipenser sinensis]